jgi:photosynthetic reaction center cytochrome c subunit
MRFLSNRWTPIVIIVAIVWLTGVVLAIGETPRLATVRFAQAAAGAPAGSTGQTSEQIFKNVTVLKGIPLDEFMGTMGVFTSALSLCCGDCHTGAGTSNPKWEDDPPRKRTARAMIQMVQNINRTNFGGRQVVTCWTCHRGQKAPSTTAPLDYAYGEPVVVPPDLLPAAPSGGPTVDQVFSKYIQALGGTARLNALTSYIAKGNSLPFGEFGTGDPAEIDAKAPNQFAMTTHQKEGDVVRTFDGTNAWWQLPLTVTPQYPLTGTMLEGARFDATLAFPWRLRDFFTNWRVSYPASLDGVDVDVVQGNTNDGMIGTLYFDKQTGLLKRVIRYARTAVGRVPTQIDYSDFRPVAGVMMPFKFSWAWVTQREDWTLTEYQPNAPIDPSRFGRPALKAAPR